MKGLKTYLLLLAIAFLASQGIVSAQTVTQTVPDSPTQYNYFYNTLTEATAWYSFNRTEVALISSVSVTFTWETDDFPTEGSLRLRHPDQTVTNLINLGITNTGATIPALSVATYTLSTTAFNNKPMAGDWAIMVLDAYGDGGHQATNVSIVINYTTPPMAFVSCTTLQLTNAAAPGATSVPVIALQVITSGITQPMDLSSITFTTAGTTNLADISNAKVYYTGNSAVFATNNQFGTVVAAPNGTFTVAGTKTLLNGSNYFWLTYDITTTALQPNLIDGTCTSATIATVPRTPTITDPVGSRRVVTPLTGNYTVGTGNYYTSLRTILSDISNCGLTANVNIIIANNLTETAQVTLSTPPTGVDFSITIKPATGIQPIITTTHTGQALYITGAKNVTIDGSNTVNGTTRDLTFSHSGTGTVAHSIYVTNTNNFNIRNTNIRNSSSNTAANIVLNTIASGTIQNCDLYKANYGIVAQNNCSDINIIGNNFGNMLTGSSLSLEGIRFAVGTGFSVACNSFEIRNNTFDGIVFTGSVASWQRAMNINNSFNGRITGNTIKNMVNSLAHSIGIIINGEAVVPSHDLNIVVANNTFSNFSDNTTTGLTFALYTLNASNVKFLHNTVNFDANTITYYTIPFRIETNCSNLVFNNNIVQNQSVSTQKILNYIDPGQITNPFFSLNNNVYYIPTGVTSNFGRFGTTFYPLKSDWSFALGAGTDNSDQASIEKLVPFAPSNNTRLAGSVLSDYDYRVPFFSIAGADVDGEVRTSANNLAGADIVVPTTLTLTSSFANYMEKLYNLEAVLTFTPQIGSTFADGITRTAPTGDIPYMNHTWLYNDTPIQTGLNYYVIDRNTLNITNTQASHTGFYQAVTSLFGLTAASNTLFLDVVNVPKPKLISPINTEFDVILPVAFSWNAANTATGYILQISTTPTFSGLDYNGPVLDTTYTLAGLNYMTQYYWRVKATRGADQSEWSEIRSFYTELPPIYPPLLHLPADNATNVTIVGPKFRWHPAQYVTYYHLQLATDIGFNNFIMNEIDINDTIHGITGLDPNTTYYWRVRAIMGLNTSAWSPIWSFTTELGTVTQNITLTTGLNMISANVTPTSTVMSQILTPLSGKYSNIKNMYGQTYAPPFQTSLSSWNIYHAYQIRMNQAATLPLTGTQIVPEATPIVLNQLGLYWLPYFRTSAMAPGTALASISGKYLQVKNIQGQVYQPPFSLSLTQMVPNNGYIIRMSQSTGTLTYPANTVIKSTTEEQVVITDPSVLVRPAHITGKTSFIAMDLQNVEDGDEIGVYTKDGMLVGSSVWQYGMHGVVVWGDDETTNVKDGAAEGEALTVKIWSKATKNIGAINQIALNDMTNNAETFELTYQTDGVHLLKGAAELSSETKLLVSPQPASTELMVKLNQTTENEVSVKLYSQEGKLSLETSTNANGNVLKVNTSSLSSGVYHLILTIDGKTYSERVVIVR